MMIMIYLFGSIDHNHANTQTLHCTKVLRAVALFVCMLPVAHVSVTVEGVPSALAKVARTNKQYTRTYPSTLPGADIPPLARSCWNNPGPRALVNVSGFDSRSQDLWSNLFGHGGPHCPLHDILDTHLSNLTLFSNLYRCVWVMFVVDMQID